MDDDEPIDESAYQEELASQEQSSGTVRQFTPAKKRKPG
jgi:hypothetical protein